MVPPIAVELSGVPETLLGNLGRRAVAARTRALRDPVAIQIADRLDYDFADAARGARLHAVRVTTFDKAIRRFLASHPAATVVALGEGLETQFWRVDNGQVRWLTVDVPETVKLRHRLLPDGPRQSSHTGSALDLRWLDELDAAHPILVSAQGLLPYFTRDQVHALIAGMAQRLPGACLIFDVVTKVMLEPVRRGSGHERDLAVDLWTWLFDRDEWASLAALAGVQELRDLTPPLRPDPVSLTVSAVARLPRRLRYSIPVFPVLEARLRA